MNYGVYYNHLIQKPPTSYDFYIIQYLYTIFYGNFHIFYSLALQKYDMTYRIFLKSEITQMTNESYQKLNEWIL